MRFVTLENAEQLYALRDRVLYPHLPPDSKNHYDIDHLPGTLHMALVDRQDNPRACATFCLQEPPFAPGEPAWRLRGMAVDDGLRGQGVGARLLEESLRALREQEPAIDQLWCNARQSAFSFYERLGFRFHSDLFEVDKIGPHKVMARSIPT